MEELVECIVKRRLTMKAYFGRCLSVALGILMVIITYVAALKVPYGIPVVLLLTLQQDLLSTLYLEIPAWNLNMIILVGNLRLIRFLTGLRERDLEYLILPSLITLQSMAQRE